MVHDHFPTSHTDDPVTIADGLQPRFTTNIHGLQPFTTVYNLHPWFTTVHYGLQSTSMVYNRSLRFTIWTAKQNKAKLSNNSKNATNH